MLKEITKICILSDTHDQLYNRVLEITQGKYKNKDILESKFHISSTTTIEIFNKIYDSAKLIKPKLFIHAGDICKQSILNRLIELGKVVAVRGNCDPEDLKINNETIHDFEYLDIAGCKIAIAHDPAFLKKAIKGDQFFSPLVPQDDPEPDILIHGHTHETNLFSEFSPNTICPGQASVNKHYLSNPASICLAYIYNKKLIYAEIIKISII